MCNAMSTKIAAYLDHTPVAGHIPRGDSRTHGRDRSSWGAQVAYTCFDDADLDSPSRLVDAIWFNQGQVCL